MKGIARWLGRTADTINRADAYMKRLAAPPHRLTEIILLRALERGADAICIGYRTEIVSPSKSENADCLPPETTVSPERSRAVEQSTQLRGPGGETGVPISFRIDETLHHFSELPFSMFGLLIEAIQHGLVAIGASESNPQPLRYFEIGWIESDSQPIQHATINTSGKRRFAEIDLEYGCDNTIWIHLRGTREVDSDVRVSQSIC